MDLRKKQGQTVRKQIETFWDIYAIGPTQFI